ncbi:MAG: ParA family protein [Anaerolineae bacterium]|nr:ParA family protein [Anaerolineae bacterium]
MSVITLLNEKGGVGKTTLASVIAAGLTTYNQRVLLVDADPQGHATLALGVEKAPCLYDLLIRDAAWRDCLRPVPNYQSFFVLPGNIETRGIPLHLNDPWKLETRLKQLKDLIDVIIVDTPPTPSLFHASIYMATDYIIHPTACEFFSFTGLQDSVAHVREFSQRRQQWGLEPIKTLGIVPTMYDGRTLEHAENLKLLQEQYGDLVWEPVPKRIIWAEAATAGLPVFVYAPATEAAREAISLVERVYKGVAA